MGHVYFKKGSASLCFYFHYLNTDWIQICLLCSVDEIFPPVSLNFAGGASMVLKPGEYLMHLGFSVSCSTCIFYFNFLEFMEVDMILFSLVTSEMCCTISFVICNLGITGWCCNVVHWISESCRTRDNNFRRLDSGLQPLLMNLCCILGWGCDNLLYQSNHQFCSVCIYSYRGCWIISVKCKVSSN